MYIVELKCIDALVGSNYTEPVSQLVLLEELLREVLQVSATELLVCNDNDLSLSFTADLNVVAEVSSSSVNLDSVVQELFECSTVISIEFSQCFIHIEDFVVCWCCSIDSELVSSCLLCLGCSRSHFYSILVLIVLPVIECFRSIFSIVQIRANSQAVMQTLRNLGLCMYEEAPRYNISRT